MSDMLMMRAKKSAQRECALGNISQRLYRDA